ncbi:hypothetical protein [Rhizobium cremeum]|uniref:hypothetical protein n=1 Tax=Rhizobium cremeum TaxID=2813827 RepID=UPI0039E09657
MADHAISVGTTEPFWTRLRLVLPIYYLVVVLAVVLVHSPGARDYVGADNDDWMRLVEVRDLLGGQGWFDLTQYRLGLDGGTLMHWSRLVDLPIAALILLFGQFMAPERAEAAALLVWPLFLILPLLAAVGIGAWRLGGAPAMHVALGLACLFVVASNRFLPGAIDHHNVQLVLIATIAAMLTDTRHRAASFALAGIACALAIAIGAETTPLVAVACLSVAVVWALQGSAYALAARAFSLALTLSISAFFFVTVPPRLYGQVTCDSLSLGYYGIATVGGIALFFSTFLFGEGARTKRFAVLAVDGVAVLAVALLLAPECLQNPLNDLDPLLVTMWLDGVTEAQSAWAQLYREPGTFGGYYAVGFFAAAVCASRILLRDRIEAHAVLLSLILASWAIALVQVRGAAFANLLSILPLSVLVAELRRNANRNPEHMGIGFTFAVATLLVVPSVWMLGGTFFTEGSAGVVNRLRQQTSESGKPGEDCSSRRALSQLAGLEPATVVSGSEAGVKILRYTPHRVLTAPYHRDQAGMLAELHIGMAKPAEALPLLRNAGATVIAYCRTDPQAKMVASMEPDGLYALLAKGEIPAYLQAMPKDPASGFVLYRVIP